MKEQQFSIRMLDRESLQDIAGLWSELKDHHQQRTSHFDEYYTRSTFAKRRDELLAKEQLAVFVAEIDATLVGFCVVSINGGCGEVDSLYTQPEHRNQKLGNRLMQRGLDWLKQNQAQPIRLLVGEGNEQVLAFYQKLGFKKRATQMEKI